MTGDEAATALGRLLTATEARRVADGLAKGRPVSSAVQGVDPRRRTAVERACRAVAADGGPAGLRLVLRSLASSLDRDADVLPMWTIPGNIHAAGGVTTQLVEHVHGARASVICSSFNLQRSSSLLGAPAAIDPDSGIDVHVFVDTAAAEGRQTVRGRRTPSTALSPKQLVELLPGAHVWQTRAFRGRLIRNHAKFVAIDHQKLVVTSANMSRSAERHNVELGLIITDRLLTQQVESALFGFRDVVYRRASA